MSFESLVSLINYYTRNPLYRNVKLSYPISRETLKSMTRRYGNGGTLLHETNDTNNVEDNGDDNSSYMDPSSSQERVR